MVVVVSHWKVCSFKVDLVPPYFDVVPNIARGKVGVAEISPFKIGTEEVGQKQICLTKVGTTQVG